MGRAIDSKLRNSVLDSQRGELEKNTVAKPNKEG